MKCYVCKRALRDGEPVVVIERYVTNEKRGDFVSNAYSKAAHAHHLKEN